MEFGLDQLRTICDQVRAISTCPHSSNLLDYAILVANRSETGRRPASSCSLTASELDDGTNSSSLWTRLRPDSVMEFGFNC